MDGHMYWGFPDDDEEAEQQDPEDTNRQLEVQVHLLLLCSPKLSLHTT